VIFDRLTERAKVANLPEGAIAALPSLADSLRSMEVELEALAEALATLAPDDAIAQVKAADLEGRFGVSTARQAYLVLSLSQIAAMQARHHESGIAAAITSATASDLGIWVRHFQVQLQMVGLTIEILDWSQRYLRGDLVRLGALQFDLRRFGGPIAVVRRDEQPIVVWQEHGDADVVDPSTGLRTGTSFTARPDDDRVLEPDSLVLDMHIPAGTRLGLSDFAHAIRDARAFFAERHPDAHPVAASGEAWLLDPQMQTLLPKNEGLHALRRSCLLYPSKLTEEKTIRRLFGPDITRAMLPSLPRELMTSLHRAVIDLLADPEAQLSARGGVVLWPEHDAVLARVDAAGG
jgi:hypothetical protein